MLLMIVGLLAMLFMLVSAYIVLARSDRQTLKLVSQADRVTQILSAINDLLGDAIRGTGDGDLVSGTAYVDAPGLGGVDLTTGKPWGSAWLASGEPVRDAISGGTLPADYTIPAVTSLSGPPATDRRLPQLMLDADPNTVGVVIEPGAAPGDPSYAETVANTRQPFMDADGDGIPDSYFGATAMLTDLANALGGQAVRATDIRPESLDWPSDPTNYLRWQQFDQTARYMVAAKIIPHGGMVQVSAPTNVLLWNSAFMQRMFGWVRHPLDPTTALALNDVQAMGAASGAVEPVLRRRGGLLAGYVGGGQAGVSAEAGLPTALWNLQYVFPLTFNPSRYHLDNKVENWQRFNLASEDEWTAWRNAVTIDPSYYNSVYPNTAGARTLYVPRQTLTTVNNSDELARIQDPNATNVTGFLPGKLKYYLGRITDQATIGTVPVGAFSSDGTFNDSTPLPLPGYTTAQGFAVVRDLAAYYKEMLQAYDGWRGSPNQSETVTLPEQALMLAVNTVAFAAPRDAASHIDAVYSDPTAGAIYVGYAPQPFITQVVAYNKPDAGPPVTEQVALAIELYNPHDSAAVGTAHDLDLSRFAISLAEPADPTGALIQLDTATGLGTRLAGRSFLFLAANDNTKNTFFEDPVHLGDYPNGLPYVLPGLSVPYTGTTDSIIVKLWRRGSDGNKLGWYVIDRLEIKPEGDPEQEWHASVQRDCTWDAFLGTQAGRPERWRMTVAFEPGDSEYHASAAPPPSGPPLSPLLHQLGAAYDLSGLDPSSELTGAAPFGPSLPLHLMNAGLARWSIHGVARPASFPTTGFLLFVPRFAHKIVPAVPPNPPTYTPVTTVLRNQWREPQQNYSFPGNIPPADFGHMPIFDNSQKINPTTSITGGFDKTGHVPWGLLVFDYFTTLDPNDGNGNGIPNEASDPPVDPYRIPGRININDASWYVLAGLPMIGPNSSGDLPLDQSGSPAFWSAASNILVGTWSDGVRRRELDPTIIDASGASGGQWYRLGPYLAQAAAAYRDRVAYTIYHPVDAPFGDAWQRNAVTAPYRQLLYGAIRGDTSFAKRGFLSLGELVNVAGFDGSDRMQFQSGPDRTVLGGYSLGVGGDFMKAVSLLALLDTHFLATRSNTFTIYVTLTDRKNPQASVRSQMTVDRSNLLPRLVWQDNPGGVPNGIPEIFPTDVFTTLQDTGPPELIGQRETSYFNARYDE